MSNPMEEVMMYNYFNIKNSSKKRSGFEGKFGNVNVTIITII